MFRRERGLFKEEVFCFVHLSVQEFLAALHALLRGLINGEGSSEPNQEIIGYIKRKIGENLSSERIINLFHCLNELNDSSLVQEDKTWRCLTEEILCFREGSSEAAASGHSLQKSHVFCRCLQVSAGVCRCLQVSRCSAGVLQVFCRCQQVSAGVLQRLDLSDNDLRDSGLNKLSVGLKSPNCRLEILRLSGCLITAEGCSSLASALRSNPTHLKELDLSFNHPGDVGTKQLSAVLEDPELSLEKGNVIFYESDLRDCGITVREADAYSGVHADVQKGRGLFKEEVFCFVHLSVQEFLAALHVSAGVLQVSAGVLQVFCRCLQVAAGVLQVFCRCLQVFCRCLQVSAGVLQVSAGVCRCLQVFCRGLQSARAGPEYNELRDSGLNKLSVGLKSPNCRLEILRLSGCLITAEGCSSLASALRSNPTHLKELDLSFNHPGDDGTKQLSAVLEDPELSLEVLRLDHCGKERLKSGVKKYHCELSVDTTPSTVNPSVQQQGDEGSGRGPTISRPSREV
ncbi:hypothetical protein D4764_0209300 [Takifugu flavidus]|uniref:Uncharacterized protein n=1 Tax=Takifugu flavidus TaxID=433684 RepID=A0A5C6MH58_9TELE|nr:hypothetical protein D4764_0209300 [Takifugu flavidus]